MAKAPSKKSAAKSKAKSETKAKAATKAAGKTASKATKPAAKPKTVKAKAKPVRSATKAATTKPRAAKARAARRAAAPKVVEPAILTSVAPAFGGETAPKDGLSKKELLNRIAAECDMKRSDVRMALDATMKVLRQAILEGEDIAAAPLGKIKIARTKDTPNGKLAILRVKLKDPVATRPNIEAAE